MQIVSGFIITHSNWFPSSDPEVHLLNESFDLPKTLSEDELSLYIQDRYNIHGRCNTARKNDDGSYQFEYTRPGFHYNVNIIPDQKKITYKEEKKSLTRSLVEFHLWHKYGGGFVYDMYVFMKDLTAIAFIVFAITGIYMWYRSMKRKVLGLLILTISIGYTATVIYFFMIL